MATVGRDYMHPKDLSIHDFTYALPEERIAKYPLPVRDSSRLLVYRNGEITEDLYKNIHAYLPPGALVIFNNTKVVEARLLFQKPTGGMIEIFCLEPHSSYSDITTAMSQTGKVWWHCLVGGASKWKRGQVLEKKIITGEKQLLLQAKYIDKLADSFIIELSWTPATLSFAELLHEAGLVPLPPYIKRAAEASDAQRYQTVYAHQDGSVAAPTAGLHFTGDIFTSLERKNIQRDFVTLHVGAGTFKPVKAGRMELHEMHAEFIEVSRNTIANISTHLDDTIIAVGTTSLRTLETLYWLGVKLAAGSNNHLPSGPDPIPAVSQWEAYTYQGHPVPAQEALHRLLQWLDGKKLERLIAKTQIIIAPGYRTRIADALVTNFHQPQSTLLLLVAGTVGDDWKKIYSYALENDFRFLSYGDGSLLWFRKD